MEIGSRVEGCVGNVTKVALTVSSTFKAVRSLSQPTAVDTTRAVSRTITLLRRIAMMSYYKQELGRWPEGIYVASSVL